MAAPSGGPESMDWRQIQTALIGTSFSSGQHQRGGEGWDNLQSVDPGGGGDPASLRAAAQRFEQLRQSLDELRQRLAARRDELVGARRWSGEAATSFDHATRQFDRTVEQAGEPLTGSRSVSVLLDRAAAALTDAQQRIVELNRQGAEWTRAKYDEQVTQWTSMAAQGVLVDAAPAQPWFTTGNGTQVYTPSAYPEVDQKMTEQARQILRELATTYRTVVGDMAAPGNLALPAVNPGAPFSPMLATAPALIGVGAASTSTAAVGSPGPAGLPGSPGLPTAPAVPGSAGTSPSVTGAPGSVAAPPASPAVVGLPGLVGVAGPPASGGRPGALPGPPAPAAPTRPVVDVRGIPGLAVSPPPGPGLPNSPAPGRPGSPFPGVGGGIRTSGSPALAPTFPFAGGGPGGPANPIGGAGLPRAGLFPGAGLVPGGGGLPGGAGPHSGMPMMPMTPRGDDREDRERTTWLLEDRDIWSVTGQPTARVLTGGADDGMQYVVGPVATGTGDGNPTDLPGHARPARQLLDGPAGMTGVPA
ncbi:WXG100 family type VII secretion target [Micromonospora echinofusca]|uniref:PPE family protein n=1 Tax=Micromonospora echinofusca TaxID=47858 RepID=A0ABS3VS17_MICEH|nr:WXG100 family type VII secretion target [Micromonospora echinofusca]MBO4207305.1 hypothetical protein [Micromonospora echinofusca]